MSNITNVAIAGVRKALQFHLWSTRLNFTKAQRTRKRRPRAISVQPVLKQVLDAGLKVTVLTRQSSNHNFSSSVNVIRLLQLPRVPHQCSQRPEHRRLCSFLGRDCHTTSAGGRRGQSSCQAFHSVQVWFGSSTQAEKSRAFPVPKDEIAVQDALKKEVDFGGLTYTLISTWPFLNWGLSLGFRKRQSLRRRQ